MKALLSMLIILGVPSAYAYPMVGDKVEFKATETEGSETKEMTGSYEVVGYNETTKKWAVMTTWIKDGQQRTKEKQVSEMFTSEKAQEIMTNCESKGGKLEDVTVGAGTFATCLMIKDQGDEMKHTWWGDVPFGVVKFMEHEKDNSETKTVELMSVTLGQ